MFEDVAAAVSSITSSFGYAPNDNLLPVIAPPSVLAHLPLADPLEQDRQFRLGKIWVFIWLLINACSRLTGAELADATPTPTNMLATIKKLTKDFFTESP
jgi:hypothetical protein